MAADRSKAVHPGDGCTLSVKFETHIVLNGTYRFQLPSPGANNEALITKLAERFGAGLTASEAGALEALAAAARRHGVEPAIG